MDGLAQLVAESLARNGVATTLDYRRLAWSQWFRCESSFSVLLVPGKPGIFALGEEVIAPGETVATEGKRLLALLQIEAVQDLGMALGRMFLPGSILRERLESGRCFVRYTVIEDAAQRQTALAALKQWMESSAEVASAA
jgi:hypothetical protein